MLCRIRVCEFGTRIDDVLGGFLCWMHQICPADCGRYGTGQPDLLPKALIHAEGMNDIACMIEKVQLPVLCSVGSNENIYIYLPIQLCTINIYLVRKYAYVYL